MTEPVVRLYEPRDERRVRHLSKRLAEGFARWREPSKVEATIVGWIDDALATFEDPGHLVLVADDGGRVIGFIAVTVQEHYIDGRDAYIGELVVDEAAEGFGVGARLVESATAWARDHGCGQLTLQTGAANDRARRFYERLGFEYEDVSLARAIDPPNTEAP